MACWGEAVVAHGVEGNAACVVVEPEDVGVGLYQAVHRVDHQKGVGGLLEDLLGENLEDHLGGILEDHLGEILEVHQGENLGDHQGENRDVHWGENLVVHLPGYP